MISVCLIIRLVFGFVSDIIITFTQAQLDRMESQIALLVSLSSPRSGEFSKDIVKKFHS